MDQKPVPTAEQRKQTFLQSFFGRSAKKAKQEEIPSINVKGEKVFNKSGNEPGLSQGSLERQLFGADKGPKMLPRAQRFKVWFALLGIGSWFVGCFFLVAYRLRSDDLELMEREVYEELRMKKEVQRF